MYGKNPVRPPAKGDGSTLDIQQIFATIQGEGPYAGMPAVFVRLGGCNLVCSFCDTEFESFRAMGLDEILSEVLRLVHVRDVIASEQRERGNPAQQHDEDMGWIASSPPAPRNDRTLNLIVITGGEPLRQPIAPLCEALISQGFKVQIETNGTLFCELPPGVEIVCSPKNNGDGYFPIRPDLLARVNAFKFIISAQHPEYRDIGDVGQGNIPVFVQPMDEYDEIKNKANLALAVELVQTRGYRLSLQLHKIIGVE